MSKQRKKGMVIVIAAIVLLLSSATLGWSSKLGDTLYLGNATIRNVPTPVDLQFSARWIKFGGDIFSTQKVFFGGTEFVEVPTRKAGSSSRTTEQLTMPYWTGNMCYIDLWSNKEGITIRDSAGNVVGVISFDKEVE